MSFNPTREFVVDVMRGNVAGHSMVYKFGYNGSVTTAEDVWSAGGTYQFVTAAETLDVASSDANDTSAGTGARIIVITGIGSDLRNQTELVTMNGTSTVTTTNSWWRVNRVAVYTTGTNNANVGTITVQGTSSTNIFAQVPAGDSITQQLIYTVEDGATLYFKSIYMSVDSTKTVAVRIFVRNAINGDGTVYEIFRQTAVNLLSVDFDYAVQLVGPADAWIQVNNPSATASVTAQAIGMQVRN